MKFKKTYGINGLLEWHGSIKSGDIKMKVSFTNGGVTAWGVAPATFTTSDELTQHIIEHSEQFIDGKIKLIRSVALGPAAEVDKKTVTDIEEVRKVVPDEKLREVLSVYNCSDARIWLKEHKNVSVVGKSKAEIIEIAKDNGIVFPNLIK